MKASNTFNEIIKMYLVQRAEIQEDLAAAMQDETKNLDDCITYILNTVQKSGLNGFADQEIFDMAIEYYTTKEIEIGQKIQSQVIVNRIPELTPEEMQEAKLKAFNDVVNDEKKKLTKKTKPTNQQNSTPTLF